MEIVNQIPPFTRFWAGGILLCALFITAGVLDPFSIFFSPKQILAGQVWRIFTSLFFLGELKVSLLINVVMAFTSIKTLEESQYTNRLGTLVFTFILVAFFVQVLSGILGSYSICRSMMQAFGYIFSKMFPSQRIVLMMIFPIEVRYLPFAYLVIDLLNKHSIIPALIGIVSGHIVFFLLFLLPIILRRPILKTPAILVRLFDNYEQPERDPLVRGVGRRVGD